jgi:hypothetical protein
MSGFASATKLSSQDAQFRRWLDRYLKDDRGDDDLQNLAYGYALVDLNGDGHAEGVVWARDGRICGTGGCNLEVFVHRPSGWKLFSSTTITRPPIRVLSTRTHGWRDLTAWQAGGGIQRPYEARLRFNGKRYRTVGSVDGTDRKQPVPVGGRIIIKDASIPLFQRH